MPGLSYASPMRRTLVILVLGLVIVAGLGFLGLYGLGKGWFGRHEGPGEVSARKARATSSIRAGSIFEGIVSA